MPTGARSTNTMGEVLVDILRQLSVAKTLPDADLEFLVNIETAVIQKLRQPLDQAMGQLPEGAIDPNSLAGPDGPPPGMGGPPPGMEQMMAQAPVMDAPMPPPPPGPGVPGLRTQPQIPPDELSRIMANSR